MTPYVCWNCGHEVHPLDELHVRWCIGWLLAAAPERA